MAIMGIDWGNNWGNSMGNCSGVVFNTSHCGGPGYRHGYRGNMREKAVAIGKRYAIDSIGISFTLFASPQSVSIRMGIMGNNWGDCMGDFGGCVFDGSHGGGPGYRVCYWENMCGRENMRKTMVIE